MALAGAAAFVQRVSTCQRECVIAVRRSWLRMEAQIINALKPMQSAVFVSLLPVLSTLWLHSAHFLTLLGSSSH